jgi:outer membrane protein OmpA-like peptidoglycan-associated protein
MKTILRGGLFTAVAAAILTLSPFASASAMDDLSWFGNTGATSGPVKDTDYSGYWWWPTIPAANSNDQEVWGNRGVVYNMYKVTPPPKPEAPKPPKPAAPVKVERKVPIANSILFDFDSSVLKAEGQKEVNRVVGIMKANAGDTLTVEGHTCDKGSDAYNQGLGQRRSDSVSSAIKSQGVAANRLTSVSKGEKAPAVANDSEANRAKNRRVVLLFKIK